MTRQDLEIFLKLRTDPSQVKNLTSALGGVRGALAQITGMRGGLAGVLAGLTGGAVVAGMKRLTEQAVVLSAVIEKNRSALKLSATETQVFAGVLKDGGAAGNEFEGAISRIQKAVGDADPVVSRLGLSIGSLRRQSGGQQLESVAVALSKIKNESDRAALSADILGRSYQDLRPLLDALAQRGFPALQEEVRKSRGIMSDYASKSLDDAIDRTEAASEKMAKSLTPVRLAWERIKAAAAEAVAATVAPSAEASQLRDLQNARDALSARRAGLDLQSQDAVSGGNTREAIAFLETQIALIDKQIAQAEKAQRTFKNAPAAGRNGGIRSGVQMKTLPLSRIRLDGGTQIRVALDQEHIDQIAEAWSDGAQIPAVVVFNDGTNYWLADGFHRYHGAQKNGYLDMEVEVKSGTRLDAVKFALSANATHGRPRTNADKRNAVAVALKEFPKLSDRELARMCAVNHEMVGKCRPQLAETASSTRIGADGKERRLPVKAIAPIIPMPAPAVSAPIMDAGKLVDEQASGEGNDAQTENEAEAPSSAPVGASEKQQASRPPSELPFSQWQQFAARQISALLRAAPAKQKREAVQFLKQTIDKETL